jgi:hypothetical protein
MQPAQRSISDTEAALAAAAPDAAKYVPDQLAAVRRELDDLKATFDRQDYGAVLEAAPAVMERAQALGNASAAKKAELTQALGDEWSTLAARLPGYVESIQSRIEFLARRSNRKMAAEFDLDAARGSLSEELSVWSKAQAAFATGNLSEAVSTAKSLETGLEGLARTLKLELKAPAAWSRSERQGAFADDHGAAADVHGEQVAVLDLEPDAHFAGTIHLTPLAAGKGGYTFGELTELP